MAMLMVPDEENDGDEDNGNSVLMPNNREMTDEEMDNILFNTQDLLTGNGHPIVVDKTPKNVEIKVLIGDNFPEDKDSDKYFVSMWVEEWRCEICDQDRKARSKTIRGSKPEWNQDFTINIRNPEESHGHQSKSCRLLVRVVQIQIMIADYRLHFAADCLLDVTEGRTLFRIRFPTAGHDFANVIGSISGFLHPVSFFQFANELMMGFHSQGIFFYLSSFSLCILTTHHGKEFFRA